MYFQKVLFFVTTIGIFYTLVDGQSVVCPAVRTTSGWLDLFPLPCRKSSECRTVMGPTHVCCKGFCTKGVSAPAQIRNVTNAQSSTSTTSTSTTTSTTTTTTTTTTTSTTPSSTSSTTTTTTTTTPKPTTTTEALRPYFTLLPILSSPATTQKPKAPAKKGKPQKLVCPKAAQASFVLFPVPCENSAQCRASSGADHVCCEARCVRGVPAPRSAPQQLPQASHQPLLGVIPRECPAQPLGELLFEVQSCKTDADCWPRVCCPDGNRSYCRTAKARLDLVPVVGNQIDAPVRMLEQYLQCTAPPQYDLFPRQCSSSVDCFPNLCCAEGGKKHCRPPQRSLLALLAGVGQRFGTTLVNLRQAQANRDSNKL
ncbi:uncharacterized protein isoform X1 [Choristoneura fumiferana]|uniref:uncharacterized protein isoform X1 n=1 Tax=Choristoneura fumiferana TaxID=7141 RepID=UPI003D158C60